MLKRVSIRNTNHKDTIFVASHDPNQSGYKLQRVTIAEDGTGDCETEVAYENDDHDLVAM